MKEITVYTIEEIMQIFRVSRITVYHWITTGQLKAIKAGRDWRITEENLKDFLERGTNYHPEEK